MKKDIARIKTVLRERELSENINRKGKINLNMEERNLRKTMKTKIGTVVSDKMDKTVVVAVKTSEMNKMYGKIEKKTYKLKAHDETNSCQTGDKVKSNGNKTTF